MGAAPDWLLNMSADDKSTVEDSPIYRAQQDATQIQNLHKAAGQALGQVEDKTKAAQIATIQAQSRALDAMKAATDRVAANTAAMPVLHPPPPRIPTDNNAVQADNTFPTSTATPQDPSADVMAIANATGMTPQQVASMALLGKEITRLAAQGQLQTAPNPVAAPPGPQPMLPPPPPPTPVAPAPAPVTPPPASAAPAAPVPLAGPDSVPPTPAPVPPPAQAPVPPPAPLDQQQVQP